MYYTASGKVLHLGQKYYTKVEISRLLGVKSTRLLRDKKKGITNYFYILSNLEDFLTPLNFLNNFKWSLI